MFKNKLNIENELKQKKINENDDDEEEEEERTNRF